MNQYSAPNPNPYAPPQAPMMAPAHGAGPYGAAPSAHVEGKLLVAANGSPLPAMCFKCGGHPAHWRPVKYQYTPPWAFFFLGWLGILIFSKRSSFQIPLCEQHRAEWKKWNIIAGLSWIPGAILWMLGAVVAGVSGDVGAVLLLLGIPVFFVGLITCLILRSRKIVMPTKIDNMQSWLRGVHPTVLQFVANPQAYAAPQPVPQVPYAGYAV
jgi:hypothetical protein